MEDSEPAQKSDATMGSSDVSGVGAARETDEGQRGDLILGDDGGGWEVRLAKARKPKKKVNKQVACRAGDAIACFSVAGEYRFGGSHSWRQWQVWIQKSCDLGYPLACESLGKGLSADSPPGFKGKDRLGKTLLPDPERSARLINRAVQLTARQCEQGEDNGEPCRYLALYYVKGFGVEVDRGKAKELFRKAIDLGDAGAAGVYSLHTFGHDPSSALEFLIYSCSKGHEPACNDLDYQRKMLKKRCDNGVKRDCEALEKHPK